MTAEPVGDNAHPTLNRDAYLARIGYDGGLEPTLETLRALHLAHACSVPFENIDIVLGRTISLDLDDLQDKLVTARRGGYCFEQNALFAAALESLGFDVTRLAARVRFGATEIRPRLHMMLEVQVDAEPWLADVGFGCAGPLYPIRLKDAEPQAQGAWRFRVRSEGDQLVLESHESDGWPVDLYAFTREPQHPVDYEIANYYTSTHPHSRFVRSLIVQKGTLQARWSLHDRELTEENPKETDTRSIASDAELRDVLADRFGLTFPPGIRFPIGAGQNG
jgi:N-hydroxyarylamine O-acetyltransferase